MSARRLAMVTAVGFTACTTTSIRDDVARVERLTQMATPTSVTSDQVAMESAEEVRELLRAPLTADSAVQIALLNNRDLRAALRDLGVERGELVQAGLLPNPTVEIDLRDPGRDDLPLQQDYFVEYALTRALLTPLRVGVAKADLEAARYRVASDVVGMGYRVRVACYAMQAAEQRFAVMQRTLDALAAARDAAKALYDAGNTLSVDLASEIAAYESARARAGEVELELLERREEMQELLGLYGSETQWTPATTLPSLPRDPGSPTDLERQVITASLDLSQTKMRLEAIAKRTGLARTEGWLPDISVDAHIEKDERAWEKGGGARIRIPVFDRNQGTVARYQAEFDALMERYQGLAIAVRSAARRTHNRLVSSYMRAKQYEMTIVPARNADGP